MKRTLQTLEPGPVLQIEDGQQGQSDAGTIYNEGTLPGGEGAPSSPPKAINSPGEGGMVYPGAGVARSTGSAWGTSYSSTNPIPATIAPGAGNTTSTGMVNGNLPEATGPNALGDSGVAVSAVALAANLPVTALTTLASQPTPPFNFTANGAAGLRQQMTMTANTSPTFSGSVAGDEITLILAQDSTGSWTVTWPSNVSAQTPQPVATPSTKTVFKFIYDGLKYLLISAVGGQ